MPFVSDVNFGRQQQTLLKLPAEASLPFPGHLATSSEVPVAMAASPPCCGVPGLCWWWLPGVLRGLAGSVLTHTPRSSPGALHTSRNCCQTAHVGLSSCSPARSSPISQDLHAQLGDAGSSWSSCRHGAPGGSALPCTQPGPTDERLHLNHLQELCEHPMSCFLLVIFPFHSGGLCPLAVRSLSLSLAAPRLCFISPSVACPQDTQTDCAQDSGTPRE